MEGLDLNWFCRCSVCGRVLTGSLEVRTCDCPYFCCLVCVEKQQPGQCSACGSEYRTRQDLVQKITQLYKGALSFYSNCRSQPQVVQSQVTDLIQAVYNVVRGPAVSEVPPQAYEAKKVVEIPPVEAMPYSVAQPSSPMCSGCGAPLGMKGRCQICHKVALEHVGFNHQAFLSNKWNCPQCSFRNVYSSDRCVNCSYVPS